MADFLEEKQNEIRGRIKVLQPSVDEHARLTAAAAALDGMMGSSPAPPAPASPARTAKKTPKTRPASAKKSSSKSSGKRRGRPKGSGTRGNEALALVKAHPGITIPEMADKMGIKQNYLYRVLPGLAEDGLVYKDGGNWFPKQTGS